MILRYPFALVVYIVCCVPLFADTRSPLVNLKGNAVDHVGSKMNVRGRRLRGIVLVGQDLRNSDFSNCDLSDAKFLECKLEGCSFENANLPDASFEDSTVDESVNFEGAVVNGLSARLSPAQLTSTWSYKNKQLTNCWLPGGYEQQNVEYDFRDADLTGARFLGGDYRNCDFEGAKINRCHLAGSLTGTNRYSSIEARFGGEVDLAGRSQKNRKISPRTV